MTLTFDLSEWNFQMAPLFIEDNNFKLPNYIEIHT